MLDASAYRRSSSAGLRVLEHHLDALDTWHNWARGAAIPDSQILAAVELLSHETIDDQALANAALAAYPTLHQAVVRDRPKITVDLDV